MWLSGQCETGAPDERIEVLRVGDAARRRGHADSTVFTVGQPGRIHIGGER